MAKELSVFVDESGDWGEYDYHAPFYIVSFVLHNQADDISKELDYLEKKLTELGFPEHCIHAGPIIRGITQRVLGKRNGFPDQRVCV